MRCILLEAGGQAEDSRVIADYEGEVNQPQHHRLASLTSSRQRMLGGTTNHWGGWSRPILPEVFQRRRWVSSEPWPFGIDRLETHYAFANAMLELGQYDFEASRVGARIGHVSPFEADDVLATPMWRFSPPTRFADRYRDELEDPNLDVVLRSPLVDVDLRLGRVDTMTFARDAEDEGASATSGGAFRVRARQYVFAMGGIESVRQLLLLARRFPEAQIDESGWLGRGWMEHPHAVVGHLQGVPDEIDLAIHTDRPLDAATPVRAGLGLSASVREELGLAGISVTLEPRSEIEAVGRSDSGVMALASVLGRGAAQHRIYARVEQRPHPQNRIELIGATDRWGKARPRLTWSLQEDDVRDLRVGLKVMSQRFAAYEMGFVLDYGAPSQRAQVGGGNHHMGGARMHEDPRTGVVDPVGRVHSVENLTVASAAVFPTSCFSNPTMTIVALASYFADSIEP
jgi:choline dehydrogenase-like flavoprotein